MRFKRLPGVPGHDDSTRWSFYKMWTAARNSRADELFPGSFFRYRGLIFSGLAIVPARGYWGHGIERLVATSTSNSSRCTSIDLPEPDCILRPCALAPVF
jgi:hypothetical protein